MKRGNKGKLIFGSRDGESHLGSDRNDLMFGRGGDDTLDGGDGNDILFGGKGHDWLFGGTGNDKLFGGKGSDTLDGGAGSDLVFGGSGDDWFDYNLSENAGAKDHYDGGKGLDALHLTLTGAEFQLAQADIEAFNDFLATGSKKAFHFESFGLTARNFEVLVFDILNTTTTNEDTLLVIPAAELLFNDTDPDPLDVLTIVGADSTSVQGAVVLLSEDGGTLSYDPTMTLSLQQLAEGDSIVDSFSYSIEDLAGATFTAVVSVTVTGVNDAPVALKDVNETDEDSAVASNDDNHLLANDFDVDMGAVLRVTAVDGAGGVLVPVAPEGETEITLDSGALLTVKADGSYVYNPNGQFESLNAGDTATDSFSYEISDGALSAAANVDIKITGVDDEPSAISVAIVGPRGDINTLVASQLSNNNQGFTFATTAISISSTSAFALDAFNDFNVVVIGEDGFGEVEMDNASLFAALNHFISLGGGVVSTGRFANYTLEAGRIGDLLPAEDISPVVVPASGAFAAVVWDSPIEVAPTDADGIFIAGQATSFVYDAQGFHEYALAKDTNAKVLATTEADDVAAAYYNGDLDGVGRTVYLGSLHMADSFFFNPVPTAPTPHTPDSPVDQLFERAVAWAAGEGPSATTTEVSSSEDLLGYGVDSTLSSTTTDADALL